MAPGLIQSKDVGGVTILDLGADGRRLPVRERVHEPRDPGYLVVSRSLGMLYAVDERKNDGRGPVQPAATVHAFQIDLASGELSWVNAAQSPGPRPTYLALHELTRTLISANPTGISSTWSASSA